MRVFIAWFKGLFHLGCLGRSTTPRDLPTEEPGVHAYDEIRRKLLAAGRDGNG